MIVKNELSLRELQQESLNILKDVHKFCKENNICYSIAYGTLIGALRHKGFIPWDDDVDIVMPRNQFERFCTEYKSDRFKLIYYGNDNTALAAFARICECERTEFQTERPWTSQKSGVWIDVFPLDGVQNENEYRKRYSVLKKLSWIVYKFRRQNHYISDQDTFWAKTKTITARIIGINGWLPNKLLRIIIKIMKKYNYDQCLYYGQMSCLDDGPLLFEKEDFNNCVLLDFEDAEFCALNGYEKVLRQLYGDYMSLPPENKRKPKQYWIHFLWKNHKL